MKKMHLLIACLVVLASASVSFAGTMRDSRDGKTYKTVKISDQTWMAENLNYKIKDSYCYDNKSANCETYGRLYTWDAAMEACPSGWHLPSKDDFQILLEKTGINSGNLRVTSWGGVDKYDFSALSAGNYISEGRKFYDLGSRTYFWSSSEYYSNNAYRLRISIIDASIDYSSKHSAYSIRCLQD